MSTSGSKSNEHMAHFLVDIHIVICVALVAAMAPAEIAMAGTGSYEGTQQNDFAGYTPVSTKE